MTNYDSESPEIKPPPRRIRVFRFRRYEVFVLDEKTAEFSGWCMSLAEVVRHCRSEYRQGLAGYIQNQRLSSAHASAIRMAGLEYADTYPDQVIYKSGGKSVKVAAILMPPADGGNTLRCLRVTRMKPKATPPPSSPAETPE